MPTPALPPERAFKTCTFPQSISFSPLLEKIQMSCLASPQNPDPTISPLREPSLLLPASLAPGPQQDCNSQPASDGPSTRLSLPSRRTLGGGLRAHHFTVCSLSLPGSYILGCEKEDVGPSMGSPKCRAQ